MASKEILCGINRLLNYCTVYGKTIPKTHIPVVCPFRATVFRFKQTSPTKPLCLQWSHIRSCEQSMLKANTNFFKSSFVKEYRYSTASSEHEANLLRNKKNMCWKCCQKLTNMSKYFCENCDSILPVADNEDFFSMMGVKKDFKISINELQFNFRQHQVLLHPDKFSLKSDFEKAISETVSAQINKAYFTLLKPLTRGIYLLELNGVFITEDISSDDPQLLMEIMELNEKVDEMTSTHQRQEMLVEVKSKVDDLTTSIARAFREKDIDLAYKLVVTYKYYENVFQRLKELLIL